MATKNYLAKIESKGINFFYVINYDPALASPIEYALLDQTGSKLVEDNFEDAEFIEIPTEAYNRFRSEYGYGHAGYMAEKLAHLFL